MAEFLKPIPGYVRSDIAHLNVGWQFELLKDRSTTAIVTITTNEGSVEVSLNRAAAISLEQQLRLFLADWPEDRKLS